MSTHKLFVTVSATFLSTISTARAAHVYMDYATGHEGNFYQSPFPGEHRRNWPNGGKYFIDQFPGEPNFNIDHVGLVTDAVNQVDLEPPWERGYGTTAGIFFAIADRDIANDSLPNKSALGGPLMARDASTPPPDVTPSVLPAIGGRTAPTVFLIDVDPSSPEFLSLMPVMVDYEHNPWGLLAIVPLQGAPLRPSTLYAAVVTDKVLDVDGHSLQPSSAMTYMLNLAAGGTPPVRPPTGMDDTAWEAYRTALTQLRTGHGASYDGTQTFSHIVGLTVYRTNDPVEGERRVIADALTRTPLTTANFSLTTAQSDYGFACNFIANHPDLRDDADPSICPDPPANPIFDDFCVYKATVDMPVYQAGTRPFKHRGDGGAFAFDTSGHVTSFAGFAQRRIFITVPRRRMPANGFPVAVLERAGSGGDNPLVSRGETNDSPFYSTMTPGSGPAQIFARAGYAGVMIDDPLRGQLDDNGFLAEDALIFNVYNLAAMRDNIRQPAVELAVLAHRLALPAGAPGSLHLDASACPDYTCSDPGSACTGEGGPADAFWDTSHLALMSHSVGSTISPLAMALEPMYRTQILSGAGGSYLDNVLYKQQPRSSHGVFLEDLACGAWANLPLREALQGACALGHPITGEADPWLNLFQWAGEPADPPVYNRVTAPTLVGSGHRDVLMIQGIVDHYIEPPSANAVSLSLGLALASFPAAYLPPWTGATDNLEAYDDRDGPHGKACVNGPTDPLCPSPSGAYAAGSDFRAWQPLSTHIALSGWPHTAADGSTAILPVQGRSVVVQYPNVFPNVPSTPVVQDGHETVFQSDLAHQQIGCFLSSSLLGPPLVSDMLDTRTCCSHMPGVAGERLVTSCDCNVAAVCVGMPQCCGTTWTAACVASYATAVATDAAGCNERD